MDVCSSAADHTCRDPRAQSRSPCQARGQRDQFHLEDDMGCDHFDEAPENGTIR